jgi:hypothetical protein
VSRGVPALATIAVLAAGALAGCQSTQQQSKELAAKGVKELSGKGLEINKESSSVKVVSATVLTDKNGSAVAVDLRNDSGSALADVPILIDVRDSKGKSVFKNSTHGLDPSLTSVPLLEPGQDTAWVNDQVFPVRTPKSVKVTVGQAKGTAPPQPVDVQAAAPQVVTDPVSGVEATGSVTNSSGQDLKNVYFYAVAREGNQVVAAGRGEIQHLKADPKQPPKYHIFFIGDPKGAQVTVTAAPPASTTSQPPSSKSPTSTTPQ